MEISLNYGMRRYFISDNYFYILIFIISYIIFLKQKRNRKRKIPISPTKLRGGDNSVILQNLYDQCLSDGLYVQVNDPKVKQIIRKMLNVNGKKPLIISASVYLVAILKNRHVGLVLQKGGNKLILSNLRAFLEKAMGSVLFAKLLTLGAAGGLIGIAIIPVVLQVLIYSSLHLDCNSFVDTLPKIQGSLQYIETVINEDAPVIVAPHTNQMLYYEYEETQSSPFTSLSCYARGNCLGPPLIKRTKNFKTTRYIPLSQRTKTLKDLTGHIDEIDAIDVDHVKYKDKEED